MGLAPLGSEDYSCGATNSDDFGKISFGAALSSD